MHGDSDEDLRENHVILNDLVHEMDKTRLTTMACVSMCSMDDPYVQIPDTVSYNHYFGWYGGDTSQNGPWFDEFHAKYPNIPIGCSEYGCEALNWHTSDPQQGDYTEEYQAYYHEELIKQFYTRKYMWATHVWNMFDFGADSRNEGGENGQNHKGLITFDRKYKKDSFYAYKAWSGCSFVGTDVGLRFKSTRGRGGVVENIFIDNINMIDIPNDALTMDLYYAVNDSPETPIPDVNEETPVFRNIYISNVLCRGAGRAVYFNGLPEMPLKNILIKNMTVTNAKKGIVINQASQVNMENIKVEDSEIPAIQIENATGVIINGKEYKKDSGKMLLSGN